MVLEDSTGTACWNDASRVVLSIASGPPLATLSNCVANLGYGETSFQNCNLSKLGQYTLQASDPTDGIANTPGNPFNITAGVPARLVFQQQPSNGTGGTALPTQPIVWIEDSSGNVIQGDSSAVTLAIGTNPSNGTLSGCTGTSNGNGVVTFTGCKIDKAGIGYTLAATDAADNLTTATQSTPFNIAVGPASQLSFTTSPGTTVAGDPFATQPVVTFQDAGGNTATATGAVSLAIGSNPGGGTLSGCTSTTTNGVTTFSGCKINLAGNGYTLVATSPGLQSATSSAFNIVTPALTSFRVVGPTGNQTAGTAFSVTVTGLDQSGFTYTGLTGTQTISFSGPANSPNGTPPAYPPTMNFTLGVATATNGVTLYDAQTTTLTATQGSVTGTSGNITVVPLTARTLSVSGFPNPTAAGAPGSVTVAANDTYGNVATGYRGTVRFSSSDARAGLPVNYRFTAADAGSHAFTNGVTLFTVGTQSITATDTVTGTITGTQGGITVTRASPTIATALSPASITAGAATHDTSTFTGLVNSTGTGTVTYSYYTDNTCTANAVTVNTVTVPTSGTVPNSSTVTFNSAGTYYWQAVYSGDANNNAASSPCTAGSNEQLTVNKTSPTISTALSATNITLGATAYDTSTLSGVVNSSGIAGITYSYYTNNTCTANAVTVNTVTVSTSGTVPNSSTVTFNNAGTYFWQAVYSGDANNNAASSPCTAGSNEQLTVNKTSPTISTALSATNITLGATAYDTSTLSGLVNSTGTGTVTYSYYTNNTCTANAVTVNAVTVPTSGTVPNSSTVTFNSAGTFFWRAVYSGDANNNAASSPCTAGSNEQLTVAKASPTVTATGPATNPAGTTIATSAISSVLASSSGPNAAGTITFKVFGPQAAAPTTCTTGGTVVGAGTTVAGNATYNPTAGFTPTTVGNYWWYASYGGDANNNTATSTCGAAMSETVVAKSSPTVTATGPASGTAGTAITTANISSALASSSGANATGTITFTVFGPQATAPTTCTTGGTAVGAGTTVTGNATYHPTAGFTPGSAGNYWWYASYGGDANNNTATSTCGAAMSETVVAKAAPTVTATGPAAGTIGTAITTANISSTLAGGTTAPAVSGTITFTVFGPQATAPTTCTTGGTAVGAGTTVTANATYHPTAGFTPGSAGNYWWYASYGGDANNNTATSTCGAAMSETVVPKFSPTVTATGPAAGTIGTAITTANISSTLAGGTTAPAVSGTITFTVFGPQATAPTTCTTGGTAVGAGTTVTANATYHPTAGFTPRLGRKLLVVRLLWRGRQQQHGDFDLWRRHVRDRGAQVLPDGDDRRPWDRHRRDRHRGRQHQLGAGGRHHRPGGERHHHLHRVRPPGHRPDHLHHRRYRGGGRDHGHRQCHLQPVGRVHPHGCG